MTYKNYLKNIKGYTDSTIDCYSRYIFLLKQEDLDYERVLEKMKGNSNNTKRIALAAIKNYYKFVGDTRATKIEMPKKEIKVQQFVKYEEYISILLRINKRTKTGLSKYIMIKLLFETGIRASELLKIEKNNIIGNRIKISGKGRKERFVKTSPLLSIEISNYIETIDTKKLFPFSYKNLYGKIKNISSDLSPHMFRRGYAKHCHDNKISIYDISLSMGHSSIATTANYIKKTSEELKIHTIWSGTPFEW